MNPDLADTIEGLELQYSRELETHQKKLEDAEKDVTDIKEAISILENKIDRLKKDKEMLNG